MCIQAGQGLTTMNCVCVKMGIWSEKGLDAIKMVDSSWYGSFHGSPGTYLINTLLDILGLDILGLDILLTHHQKKWRDTFWEVGKSNLGFSPDFVA